VKASDPDRERVVELLNGAATEGRLDSAELEERVAAALAARTDSELGVLTADLPPLPRRTSRPRRRARPELRAYLQVMALLVAIWALTGAGYFWPVWPALGWGVALMAPIGTCGRHSRTRAGRRTAA